MSIRPTGKIEAIVGATSESAFPGDSILQAAVLHHLTVAGEAINRLSPPVRDRHPRGAVAPGVGVRHRIVDAYSDLDWQILWVAATEEVPVLRKQIIAILEQEFSE